MTKKTLLLLLITLQFFTATAQTSPDQLKDDFIRTYNPDGYNGYRDGLELRDQGLSLVASLKNGLNQNIGLTESLDPAAILHDFNSQIQNIESLEANFKKSTNSYDFNAGQSIGNSFNSGDFEQGMGEVFGFLGGLEGRNQAKRQAAAQKESLRRERDTKMTNAYWKAQDYNSQTILEYAKAAAFAESVAEEKYFYSYVTNLECFSKSMAENFSTTNSYWLTNNCAEPIKNEFSGIENTFVAKDVQYLNIAKRKYKRFEETGYEPFRDAAIAFTAAVVDADPSAKLFAKIGDYYVGKSTTLALINYLTAQTYDKNFFSGEGIQKLNLIKKDSEEEIREAIETDNKEFLNAFLDSNLDKTISIEGKSILNYAIELDQPDAVQIILNKYTKNKTQDEKLDKLRKTVMMAAIYDSPDIIQRVDELGIPIDFKMNGYRPIDVAEKSMSTLVFDYYIKNLEDGPVLLEKFKSTGSDLFKYKNVLIVAGFLNPSVARKDAVNKFLMIQKEMGPEKFKTEGFTNENSYELAILMIDAFKKTKDELSIDISQRYNELKNNSAKVKVVNALIEVDAYKTIMKILESDPNKEYLVEKHEDLYKIIIDESLWERTLTLDNENSYKKYLLNTETTKYNQEALHKIVNTDQVPLLISAVNKKNKWGFFDGNGNIAIPFIYDLVDPFYNELALVSKDGKCSFIDKNGETKISLESNIARSFYDGLALVLTGEEHFISIDTNGNKIADLGKVVLMFKGTSLIVVSKNEEHNLMHRNGQIITNKYTFFENEFGNTSVSENVIMVKDKKTDKIGFIDFNGNIIIPAQYYSGLPNFSDDLFFVKKEAQGNYGIINSKNKEVTDFIYTNIYSLFEGKIFSPQGESYVDNIWLDKNGYNISSPTEFQSAKHPLESNSSSVFRILHGYPNNMDLFLMNQITLGSHLKITNNMKKGEKLRYGVTRSNTEIIPSELISIVGFNFDHIKLELDGKTFYVNIQGDIVEHKE